MVTNKLHEFYHVIEGGIAKLFGENARYKFIYLLGCPVCRSKNAQDLPIRSVELTP